MDQLKQIFEYQRFACDPKLQKEIDKVCRKYFAEEIGDDELNVSAAGNPWVEYSGDDDEK